MSTPKAPRTANRPTGPPGHRALLAAWLVLTLLGLSAVAGCTGRDDTLERPGWNLIWNEEFAGNGLNYFAWNAQDVPSPRNNELQYYTPNNVRVGDGKLRLTSDRAAFGGRSFTSGAVDTFQKFSFTYGRVEVRARLPEMGQGIWPALWMLGTECNPVGSPCPWPTAGANEIDIMEAVNRPTPLYADLHYGTTAGVSMSTSRIEHPAQGLSSEFHTFAAEWDPGGQVRWYLDSTPIGERTAPGFFDRPMYVFLNVAVGGDWPGPPDSSTAFPQHFDIDFVRVYQRR